MVPQKFVKDAARQPQTKASCILPVGRGENALVSRRRCRIGTLEPLLGRPSGPARDFSFSCGIGMALQLVKILDTTKGCAEARPAEPPETIHRVLKGFRPTHTARIRIPLLA